MQTLFCAAESNRSWQHNKVVIDAQNVFTKKTSRAESDVEIEGYNIMHLLEGWEEKIAMY